MAYGSGSNDTVTFSLAGSVANLVWKGTTDPNWNNNTTANFENGGSPDVFRLYDNVTFNDTALSFSPVLVGTLYAGALGFNNTTDYTLGGAGSLASCSIAKSGSGKLTIANTAANTYAGAVTVNGGTLVAGVPSALGTSAGGTTVNTGGTLDLYGQNLGTEQVSIAGTGAAGEGAIINTGAVQTNALRLVTLTGDASVGGAVRWDIRGPAATLDLAGHKLTKTGSCYFPVVDTTVTDGSIDVNAGTLGLSAGVKLNGSGTVTANTGGILEFGWGTTGSNITRDVVMNGGTLTSPSGNNGINSPIAFGADTTVDVTGTSLALGGALTDTGSARTLTKTGSGTLFVSSAASTRTGPLVIDNGIVQANASGALGSGPITIGHTNTTSTNHALQLNGVTIGNDVESHYMYTNYLGSITAVGGSASTINGNVTIHPVVTGATTTQGGHLASSGTGSVLVLMGELNVGGSLANIIQRAGTVEYGGGASTSYTLAVSGTARVAADDGLGAGVLVKLGTSAAATLDLNGHNQTLAGVVRGTTSATIVNQGASDSILTVSPASDLVYSGVIQDGGTHKLSLVKAGSGSYTISGANTHSGATTVQGGTLAGTGSTSSDLTVNAGATLAPGNGGTGTFGTKAAVFDAGSTLAIEINSSGTPASDLMDSYGNVTLGSGVALTVTDVAPTPAVLPVGTKLILVNYTGASLTGTFNGLPEGAVVVAGSNKFTISYVDSSAVTLTAAGAANNYASWSAANAAGQAADLDYDNDGVSNGIEYFMGQTGSSFTAMPAVVNNSGTLSVTWTKGASYTGVYGTDHVVETSTTLASGSWAAEALGGTVTVSGNDVTYTFPAGPVKNFARLKVTGP